MRKINKEMYPLFCPQILLPSLSAPQNVVDKSLNKALKCKFIPVIGGKIKSVRQHYGVAVTTVRIMSEIHILGLFLLNLP